MRRIVVPFAAAAAIVAVAAAVAPTLASADQTDDTSYYLALGDSLAVGIQPNAQGVNTPTTDGYVNQVYTSLHNANPAVTLVDMGCSGETTGTLINGGICNYPPGDITGPTSPTGSLNPTGSQLRAALKFLHDHSGHVSLITIDIGANDLNPCIALTDLTQVQACVQQVVPQAAANLTTIMTQLRDAAGASVRIIGMRYYDPELADWLTGPSGQQFAQASVSLLGTYNDTLAGVYSQAGARAADVFAAFNTTDFTDLVSLTGFGTVPLNVATICNLTWECVPPPQEPNEHPNAAGYQVIAQAFLAANQ
jgi:lysophospholipase L1-like esterase